MDKGFFKAEKLTIEPAVAEGGAAVVPAVMSGDNQIGFSNVTSLMIAKEQNLPLKPIAAGVNGAASEDEAWDALLSPKGGVTDLKAARGQEGVGQHAQEPARDRGPQLAREGRRGLVEGASSSRSRSRTSRRRSRPSASTRRSRWSRSWAPRWRPARQKLAEPFEEVAPNLTIAEYFTTEKYAQENADVVERFQRAMNKSLEFAPQNPDEVRRIITTYTKTPEAAAEKMALPTWSTEVDGEAMNTLVELSKKYGVLKGDVDVDAFVELRLTLTATTSRHARPALRVPDAALPWLGVLGVLVLIELVVRAGLISSRYFPPITETGAALVRPARRERVLDRDRAHARGLGDRARASRSRSRCPLGLALGFSEVLYRAAGR